MKVFYRVPDHSDEYFCIESIWDISDLSNIAVEAAEHYGDYEDGWHGAEPSSDLMFTLHEYEFGPEIGAFLVVIDYEPVFYATEKVKND